jgi:hypothetical protein
MPKLGVFFYSFLLEAEFWTLDDIPMCKQQKSKLDRIDSSVMYQGLIKLNFDRPLEFDEN